jgi:hypothetical protein
VVALDVQSDFGTDTAALLGEPDVGRNRAVVEEPDRMDQPLLRELPSGRRYRDVSSGDVEAHGNTHRPESKARTLGR